MARDQGFHDRASRDKNPKNMLVRKNQSRFHQEGKAPDHFRLMLSSLGNDGFGKLIQGKLDISRPGDHYERQADQIADQIVNQYRSGPADIQRQVDKVKPGRSSGAGVSKETEAGIKSLSGKGNALSRPLRDFFEPHFGDLSDVRVHTGRQANRLNESIGAKAFTYGKDIAFRSGEFKPGTKEGKRLIGHELTHVVQQSGGVRKKDMIQRDTGYATQDMAMDEYFSQYVTDLDLDSSIETVDEATVTRARNNIDELRQILNAIHRNFNSSVDKIFKLEGLKIPEQEFYSTFVSNLAYGYLDAIGIIMPEGLETPATVVSKALQAFFQGLEAYNSAIAENARIMNQVVLIDSVVDSINYTLRKFSEMKLSIQEDPVLAHYFAHITLPPIPEDLAEPIYAKLEFVMLKTLMRTMGGLLILRKTDDITIDTTRAEYENTEHYRKAIARHNDPLDNWFIEDNYGSPGSHWGSNRYMMIHSLNAFRQDEKYKDCYWEVYRIENVAEELITYTLGRMKKFGIPKEELFKYSSEYYDRFSYNPGPSGFQTGRYIREYRVIDEENEQIDLPRESKTWGNFWDAYTINVIE